MARLAVEAGVGGAAAAYAGLLLQHHLNVSGIPPGLIAATPDVMAAAVAESIYDTHVHRLSDAELVPITGWIDSSKAKGSLSKLGKRVSGGAYVVELEVAANSSESCTLESLLVDLEHDVAGA